MFESVVRATLGIVLVLVPLVVLVQPDTLGVGARVIAVVAALSGICIALSRRGRTRMAAWLFILGVVLLVTFNGLNGGGIHTPGISAYLVVVLLAGLLLGRNAGVKVAILCAAFGLGLVLLENFGVITGAQRYGATAQWLLSCVFIGLTFILMHLATRTVARALDQATAELGERRALQERLEQALEAGAIGYYDLDLRRREIRGDRRLFEILGLSPNADGVVGIDDWLAIIHPDDRTRVTGALGEMIAGTPKMQIAYRVTRPGDSERYIEAAAHLRKEQDGRPASLVGMTIDVTERRKSQRERVQLLRDLGERVKELRLLHDVSSLLRTHRGFDRVLLEQIVARIPQALMHPELARARVVFADLHVATDGWRDTPWRLVAEFSTSRGRGVIEVGYVEAPPTADGEPFLREERELLQSLAQMLRTHLEEDAAESQRRALETQLREAQKMEALGTLAGGIAHDFNNILTAIGGHVDLARADLPADHPATDSLSEIARAYGRARDLVRRILLFSRREEGRREVIALTPVLEEALHLLRASLPPNVRIEPTLAPDLPPVLADGTQLHQVMMNLGTNAGYAMREAGGALQVAVDLIEVGDIAHAPSPELREGPTVRWRVRDTGSGMDREVMQRLFEPFFTTKGLAGTGLGLSVVHGIVRDHGGHIAVQSAIGRGTEFTIYLPAAQAAPQQAAVSVAGPVRGEGQHILCVDDEEVLAFLTGRILSRLGYRCTEFTDPHAALQELRGAPHAFDAVITDLQMPGMNGIEFARAVRAVRADIPIALVSGMAHTLRDETAEAGITAWIDKPSTIDELSRGVHGMFNP